MNKLIKTSLIATALCASAPLFANTTSHTTGASANAHLSTSAEVETNNKGLIKTLSQGTSNAAERVGQGIEKGVDNTKNFSKDKWQDTKDFAAEKNANAKERTQAVKDKLADRSTATKEKVQHSQEKWSERTDKAKQATQDKWNRTKAALTPTPHQADAKTNSSLEVNTPIGSAKAGINTDGSVKTQ